MKLLFELSGENPTLPCAEIECVATVLDSRPQVAVAECPVPGDARRLAMTHVVLEYLGECAPDVASFRHLLADLSITAARPFSGRAKLVHEGCLGKNPCSQREFERLIGTMITGPSSSSTRSRSTGRLFQKTGVISAGFCTGSIGAPTTSVIREGASFSIPA